MHFQHPLVTFIVVLIANRGLYAIQKNYQFYRTYECLDNNRCVRTKIPCYEIDENSLRLRNEHTTLESCRLVCGETAGLWPLPTSIVIHSKRYIRINPLNVLFKTDDSSESTRSFLFVASDLFLRNIKLTCGPDCNNQVHNLSVRVVFSVTTTNEVLDWETEESYKLSVTSKENEVAVNISADTIYGARHALETLSQLIVRVITPEGDSGLAILESVIIKDRPKFPHRGLLIDTGRNFLSMETILRTIDALAATKMNVLHWHMTDSQSFPLKLRTRPIMAFYGAYSPEMTYSLEDFARVVHYAKYRGVRVILELDSPAHVGAGWEWAPAAGLGNITVCFNYQPWRTYCIQPPCGQMNPTNPELYTVLRDIYGDVMSILGPGSTFHLGGDEVFMHCWNSTLEITETMTSWGMGRTTEDFLKLWANLHVNQRKILDDLGAGNTSILWSSALTNPKTINRYLNPERFVIQTWLPASSNVPMELLKLGYRIILSTKDAWYLDHGFWGNTKYYTWRKIYNNRIPTDNGVLGGEVCMWGEYVTDSSFDTRVWPRTAAAAERLWSDPETGTLEAEPRLQSHKTRLEARNINTDALTPEWCNQHEQMCL